jgi:hypothetical protein
VGVTRRRAGEVACGELVTQGERLVRWFEAQYVQKVFFCGFFKCLASEMAVGVGEGGGGSSLPVPHCAHNLFPGRGVGGFSAAVTAPVTFCSVRMTRVRIHRICIGSRTPPRTSRASGVQVCKTLLFLTCDLVPPPHLPPRHTRLLHPFTRARRYDAPQTPPRRRALPP